MKKAYNFNAGPCVLPQQAIDAAIEALKDFKGTGMPVISVSHRSKEWEAVMDECRSLWRELLDIPENYEIVFLGGGASLQFLYVAMNLLENKAGYLETGVWAKKALKEAKGIGNAVCIASSADKTYNYIPKGYEIPADLDYFHITTNNTIFGTHYTKLPEGPAPLVADMSSNILGEVYDVNKFGVIYAGAQKNIGISGLCVAIIRKDLFGRARKDCPKIMNWEKETENGSMINTPNTFAIYVAGECMKWLKAQGGVEAIEKVNQAKAAKLYDFIDNSGFYSNPAKKEDRSIMNVTFVTGNPDTDAAFVKFAAANGLASLKGHRLVGGMRASIYNAMPMEGVDKLIDVMKQFAMQNK